MKSFLATLVLGLSLAATPAFAAPLNVIASFSILGDITREIGGDKITLTTLVGPDGDAHTFEPAPVDARALHSADIIVMNGLHFEGWMEKLVKASGTKATLVVASKGITPLDMDEDGEIIPDPHAWQDLANGAIYVRNIEAALSAADPEDASTYKANAAALLARLDRLDQWTRAEIAAIPAAKRKVITTHDAFGYFGAAYGVTFLAPAGLSTDAEPGAGSLSHLIDQIKEENIKALFIENMSDPRLMDMLSRETNAQVGGELYSDALSPADGPAPTYPAVFENNVPKLVAAMKLN
ncbi:MAG: metal ABC transporter substrate-binding protein [Parvibaculum sp.]|nr:metal ABC transporter substrate-binding protein [Parvibaculum sp.]|tara:strand:- start:1623 stop:2507 length:885 start_codon:yes stop_codon:yes gene_type:complete